MSGGIKMNESIVKEISTNLNITENQVNVILNYSNWSKLEENGWITGF